MLIQVKLLGELGRRFGRNYEFDASSPKEIMSALSHQLKGFREYMINAHADGMGFRLVDEDPEGMSYEEVMMGCKRLIIAPIVSGAGAIGRILLGAALIGVAIVSGGAGFAGLAFASQVTAGAAGATAGAIAALAGNIGIALVLSGVAQLLSPSPKTPGDTEKKDSFLFDNATETSNQGLPVPLLYGRFLASSPLVISSSISTVGVAA
jgi:predicted phage tail protein